MTGSESVEAIAPTVAEVKRDCLYVARATVDYECHSDDYGATKLRVYITNTPFGNKIYTRGAYNNLKLQQYL